MKENQENDHYKTIAQNVAKVVMKEFDVQLVTLFGSVARGSNTPNDIDIIIEYNLNPPLSDDEEKVPVLVDISTGEIIESLPKRIVEKREEILIFLHTTRSFCNDIPLDIKVCEYQSEYIPEWFSQGFPQNFDHLNWISWKYDVPTFITLSEKGDSSTK